MSLWDRLEPPVWRRNIDQLIIFKVNIQESLLCICLVDITPLILHPCKVSSSFSRVLATCARKACCSWRMPVRYWYLIDSHKCLGFVNHSHDENHEFIRHQTILHHNAPFRMHFSAMSCNSLTTLSETQLVVGSQVVLLHACQWLNAFNMENSSH